MQSSHNNQSPLSITPHPQLPGTGARDVATVGKQSGSRIPLPPPTHAGTLLPAQNYSKIKNARQMENGEIKCKEKTMNAPLTRGVAGIGTETNRLGVFVGRYGPFYHCGREI